MDSAKNPAFLSKVVQLPVVASASMRWPHPGTDQCASKQRRSDIQAFAISNMVPWPPIRADFAHVRIHGVLVSRYDAQRGLLTLTSTRYADREANRRDIVRMIHMLVEAGRAHSASIDLETSASLYQRKA